VRAITLHQPYAGLVALGLKRYETRTWGTSYRGEIAICAAALWTPAVRENALRLSQLANRRELADPPLGVVVALAELTECREMLLGAEEDVSGLEVAVGNWKAGNYAWRLENVRDLAEPMPIKGRQGLFRLTPEQILEIRRRVA